MAIKLPRKHFSSPDVFPRRVLALDLLAESDSDEEGNGYSFEFIDEERSGRDGDHLWSRVSDILAIDPDLGVSDWVFDWDLGRSQQRLSTRILNRLYKAICVDPTVVYFEETAQDLDRVLHIFIRRNSGGAVRCRNPGRRAKEREVLPGGPHAWPSRRERLPRVQGAGDAARRGDHRGSNKGT